jgi:hypothetical protein
MAASPSFDLPLLTTLVPTTALGSSTPTFTRATTAYVADHEGILRQVPSGCARFQGARFVRNLFTGSASLATQGVTTIAGDYTVSFTGTGTITFSGAYVGSLVGQGASTRVGVTITVTAGTLTNTVSGTVSNAQLEFVDGQSNKAPSSYVDSATSYGAGVNGCAFFATTNGNSLS